MLNNKPLRRAAVAFAGALAMSIVLPSAAAAQRREWHQVWGPYPGRYYVAHDGSAVVRIDVEPTDAEVFVDGYLAGLVDDFDGVFQRLRLPPGGHEIVIYHERYRTVRRNIYLQRDATVTIRDAMEPLAGGERAETPPTPAESVIDDAPGPAGVPRAGSGRRPSSDVPSDREIPARFGTLSLRVQPGDAEVFIDGERSSARVEDGHVALRLAEGRHRVEVQKDGYRRYTEDVLIRRGATLTLDVALTR